MSVNYKSKTQYLPRAHACRAMAQLCEALVDDKTLTVDGDNSMMLIHLLVLCGSFVDHARRIIVQPIARVQSVLLDGAHERLDHLALVRDIRRMRTLDGTVKDVDETSLLSDVIVDGGDDERGEITVGEINCGETSGVGGLESGDSG